MHEQINKLKPSLREGPDHFILFLGTIGFSTERSSELIAKSIADLVKILKSGSHDESVNIIVCTDNANLNEKGFGVNLHLQEINKTRNFSVIDHSKKTEPSSFNRDKLHLNKKRSKNLGDVLLKQICNGFA